MRKLDEQRVVDVLLEHKVQIDFKFLYVLIMSQNFFEEVVFIEFEKT